ncbi:MAG: aldo/keto reductase family protein [Acidimicrobiales bacterium]|nr:aldo/keto reductase family protein [Actinomycetota bacterium]
MEYRRLGSSDLVVSEISLGSWLTYGAAVERERAVACINRAFDLGINFFDTANVYGRGAAESFLGEALSGRDRSSYFLATKAFWAMSETDHGLSAPQIRKQSEASLKRLRTDYVDLYQCHRYDEETPIEETMEALTELVRQGKARYIGFSEWTAHQIHAAITLPGVEKFVSSQPEYSMLWRKLEGDVLTICKNNGISQIVWSPLAQGALTGKYLPGQPPPEGSRGSEKSLARIMGRFREDSVLEAVQRLRPIAADVGVTMAQLALAWVLGEENVASAIVGASRPEQLDENAAASGVKLDDATLEAIDEALGDAVGP